MAHIRQKFRESQLDGYQRKKYVCKIMFTYIQGYPVDIGHMEAVALISSNKYSEKQIGYLALTLMLHEHSDLLMLVINTLRKDLQSHNELHNCLALQTIATIGGQEMAEALASEVHSALVSATSHPTVKKKAALTLLKLYRKYPDVINVSEWAEEIIPLLLEKDSGVVMSVVSLVLAMAQDHLALFASCYGAALTQLTQIVIEKDYQSEYLYYKVPNPWLQVKLLKLLQYYPPPAAPDVMLGVQNVINAILAGAKTQSRNTQQNNAQDAILFEAINLAIHVDTGSTLVSAAADLLGKFIQKKETNIRYLGLDTMAHLAACTEDLEPIKQYQQIIIDNLKDRDISIRRRAVDLLYSMCDGENATSIVKELLAFLPGADYALREDLVLKIAILTEKFATEYQWYLETILQLMSVAGDQVTEEIWFRLVQIILNFESLQEHAARAVFASLKNPQCHENLIKVAAYVLGEFGHLIANDPGCAPADQFHLLHSKSNFCSPATRAILLTTYVKWVNLFPEIKHILITVFERYRLVLDVELQQRACEYLALAQLPDSDDLIQVMCDEMPPFTDRSSALLARLEAKQGDTEDKRTWKVGGNEANTEMRRDRLQAVTAKDVDEARNQELIEMAQQTENENNEYQPQPHLSPRLLQNTELNSSLQGLAILGEENAANSSMTYPAPLADSAPSSPLLNGHEADDIPPFDLNVPTSPDIQSRLTRLTFASEGCLHEDSELRISLKMEFRDAGGRLSIDIANLSEATFSKVSCSVVSDHNLIINEEQGHTQTTIEDKTSIQRLFGIRCVSVFDRKPVLDLSYRVNSSDVRHRLRLPIVLSRFLESAQLQQSAFFERWRQIGGPPMEAQTIYPFELDTNGGVDINWHGRVLSGHSMGLLSGIDPNPGNHVGAAILHTTEQGKIGCLLRLEPNKDAKLCRLTIRTTNANASAALVDIISSSLRLPPL